MSNYARAVILELYVETCDVAATIVGNGAQVARVGKTEVYQRQMEKTTD